MKKGFTLVEIIISISLIIIIGVGAVVVYTKNNHHDEKTIEFLNDLKLSANVYLEGVKNDTTRIQIEQPNDFIYLTIADLVKEGLLKEELNNPYENKKLSETMDKCVKVYMDDDYQIIVDYIENSCKDRYDVHLINNGNNKILLPDSRTIWDEYIDNPGIISSIQGGGYFEYSEPGYYLTDYKGEIINTIKYDKNNPNKESMDWKIDPVWHLPSRSWEVTYSINPDGPLEIEGKGEIEKATRIVYLKDGDGPILVNKDTGEEYNGEELRLENYYDTFYLDYEGQQFVEFDNFDGTNAESPFEDLDYYNLNQSYGNYFDQIVTLRDSSQPANESNYNTKFYVLEENGVPECKYDGSRYYYENEIRFDDFWFEFSCFDPDDDDFDLVYSLYNESKGYYVHKGEYLTYGKYELYYYFEDDRGACDNITENIYVDKYSYDDDDDTDDDDTDDDDTDGGYIYEGAYNCWDDISCLKDWANDNSDSWHDCGNSTCEDYLHNQNVGIYDRMCELGSCYEYDPDTGEWYPDGYSEYDGCWSCYGYYGYDGYGWY